MKTIPSILILALALIAFDGRGQTYQLTDLGALMGANSYAQGINNQGQVVGYWDATNGAHAFLYQAGTVSDLGLLGLNATNNYALSINNAGQVVGFSETTNGSRAFLYQNGSITNLGSLGGLGSYAFGINGNGQIVGYVDTPDGARAILYDNSSVINIGTLGGTNSFAFGINNSRQVAGSSLTADNVVTHAFLWQTGTINDLNQLQPYNSGWELTDAHGINDAGNIVGWGMVNNQKRAFLFYSSGVVTDLGVLTGGTNSYALGLNNSNQVVGAAATSGGIHAVVWRSGVVNDLNHLINPSGWALQEACGINDLGQIVGWGVIEGQVHAFLLTPIVVSTEANGSSRQAGRTLASPLTMTPMAGSSLTVSITNPVNNATFSAPTNITINAAATDSGGTVTQVQFLVGTRLLGVKTNSPYSLIWSNAPVGIHALTAIAADNTGLTGTSSVVNVSISTNLLPMADAHVRDGSYTNTNFGTNIVMECLTTNGSGNNRDIYFKFDLTSVSNISSAKLSVFAKLGGTGSVSNTVYSVTNTSWTETGIKWTNKPARATALTTNSVTGTNWYLFDVTGFIQSQKNAGSNIVSLALHDPANYSLLISINSKENTTNKPSLVIVTTNSPLSVSITNPLNNALFAAPANITINASASDSDGTVTQVQFFQGTNSLGGVTSAPYSVTWSNVSSGAYVLTARAADSSGIISTSSAVNVVVDIPPSISVQPTNQTVAQGSNAVFTVTATGTAPLSYRWFFNGTNYLAGATNASLTLTNVQLTNAGNYSVIVTNVVGSVTSSNAVLTVLVPPLITQQPTNQTVVQGSNVTFSVTATGTAPLNYQWRFNTTNLLFGATNSSLIMTNVQSTNAGNYSVVVTNFYGALTSSVAVLTVLGPTINLSPGDLNYLVGAAPKIIDSLATVINTPGCSNFNGRTLTVSLITNAQPEDALGINNLGTNVNRIGVTNNYVTYWSTNIATFSGGMGSNALVINFLSTPTVTTPMVQALLTNINYRYYPSTNDFLGQRTVQFVLSDCYGNTNYPVGKNIDLNCPWTLDAMLVIDCSTSMTNSLGGTNSKISAAKAAAISFITQDMVFTNDQVGLVTFSTTATNRSGLTNNPNQVINIISNLTVIDTTDIGDGIAYAQADFPTNVPDGTLPVMILLTDGLPNQPSGTNPTNYCIAKATLAKQAGIRLITIGLGINGQIDTNLLTRLASSPGDFIWATNTDALTPIYHSIGCSLCRPPSNQPPVVQIIAPTNNASFYLGTPITVTAAAYDIVDTVASVQFYYYPKGGATNLIPGTVTQSGTNWSVVWTNAPVGSNAIYAVVADYAGLVTTSAPPVNITVQLLPPVIIQQPTNQTICAGSPVTFCVSATGSLLNYQWQFNGTNIAGATNSCCTLTNVQPGQAGTYSVTVTNVAGTTNSSGATLTVNVAPTITGQPINQTVCAGATAGFCVTATGNPLNYQWQFNGTNIAGATGGCYTLTNVQPWQAGNYSVVVSNSCGWVVSSNGVLTVNTAPVITGQPTNQTVCAGATVGFCVTATGSALNYQWQFNGTNIAGATGSCYTLTNVQPWQAGNYSVVVSNSCGWVVSSNGVLTVNTAPVITGQPTNQTVCAGVTVGFCVTATGSALNYQWQFNGTNIAGATGSCYTLTNVQPWQAGNYSVMASNGCSWVVSSNAVLTVNTAPTITGQPNNETVCAGVTTAFCVTATGSALNYQWQFNGTNIAGATGSCYTLTNVQPGQAGNYSVMASNSCGWMVSSNAALTVNVAPTITGQPTNRTVCVGSSATFCVSATGSSLNYQWQFNGTNIAGATGGCYTVTNAQLGQAGNYSVVVSNSCGSVTSSNAVLKVSVRPVITSQPLDQTVCVGSSATFCVGAAGDILYYQWYFNGTYFASSTNGCLTLTNVQPSQAGNYFAVVLGTCAGAVSSNAVLTVSTNPPVITSQPTNQTVCAGATAGFCVTATGNPLNYQWQFNGTNIAGATGGCYTLTNVQPGQAGNYSVVVSNSCGWVVSSNAVLTVNTAPTITGQPNNETVCAGVNTGFCVTATGSALNYQWQFNGTNIAGATGSCYTLTNVQPGQAGNYSVVVSNSCGWVVSSNATLTVKVTPVITSQPTNQTVCAGSTVTLCVSATGAQVYQWVFNGNTIGGNSSCLTLTNVQPSQAGTYFVVVVNSSGGCYVLSSNAVLTVNRGPVITSQPTNQTVCAGSTATFCLSATGTNLIYQWYFNGTNIASSGSCLTLTNVQPWQAGNYFVVVYGNCGGMVSSNAVLTVNTTPVITGQPTNQTVCARSAVTFCVSATGTNLNYQWFFNGTNIAGATGSYYTLTNVQSWQAGNYSAAVSNSCGWVVSSNALLTVPANTTAVGPTNLVRNVGQTAGFATTASGSGPFSYVWRKNGGLLSGQVANTLTITNVALSDAGAYTVEVTGACGSATNSATLTVMGAPTIIIVNPTEGQSFNAPARITLASAVGDPAGTILYVDYYTNGVFWSRVISPYQTTLANVLAGSALPRSLQFTAVAYSSSGLNATSPPVNVTIIPQAPVVSIETPPSNAVFSLGEPIVIQGTASDRDGWVTSVQLFDGNSLLGTTVPGTDNVYSFIYGNLDVQFADTRQYVQDLDNEVFSERVGGSRDISLTLPGGQAVTFQFSLVPAGMFEEQATWTPPAGVQATLQPLGADGLLSVLPYQYWVDEPDTPVDSYDFPAFILTTASGAQYYIYREDLGEHFINSLYAYQFYVHAYGNAITPSILSGTNVISAVAYDNDGLSATSTVPISVQGCTPPGVSNLVLSVSEILGGGQLYGTVILSNAVPDGTGGQAVNLYSSSSNVVVPGYVFIPQGQRSNTFVLSTVSVTITNYVTINAAYHGQTGGAALLTVLPSGTAGSAETAVRPGFDATILDPCDDCSFGPIDVGFELSFYCNAYTNLWINNNGNLTFNWGYSSYTPASKIQDVGQPMIAAFWADVVTWNWTGDKSPQDYGQAKYGTNIIDGHPAFGVTWDDVGYYYDNWELTNRFQIVLIERADTGAGNFDIEFNYQRIQWETGNVSPPWTYGGFGGYPARFGYGNGYGDGFELPGSGVSHALTDFDAQGQTNYSTGLIYNSFNSTVPGRYIFPIRCNSSGPEIIVRNDQVSAYSPFTVTSPAAGAASVQNATFDVNNLNGDVWQTYLQRCGALQHAEGAVMDLELGAASLSGTAFSFGLLWPSFQIAPSPANYCVAWMLPTNFNADLQGQLNGTYQLLLTNRVSSLCGNTYSVTDAPNTNWPFYKNILAFEVKTDRNVPQGRCRSFLLDTADLPPLNGDWDILFLNQIIASSGNPRGWDVEEDHTIFGGFTIAVPLSATASGGYELRVHKPDWLIAKSVRFSVAPKGNLNTAPVLLPLTLSTNLIASPTILTLTVSLDYPAPIGGAYVPIYTNGMPCTVVVIPAGQTTNTTTISASGTNGGSFEILASYNGYRKAKARYISGCDNPGEVGFVSVGTSNNTIVLVWTNDPPAASYTVNRGLAESNLAPVFIGLIGLATNQFVDADVIAGTNYYYQIIAYNDWCTNASPVVGFLAATGGRAPTPLIIPYGRPFYDSLDVLLTNYVSDLVIYYTTNGSSPTTDTYDGTFTNGGTIHLSDDTTIQAFNSKTTYDQQTRYDYDSSINSARFIKLYPTPIQCSDVIPDALTATNAYATGVDWGWYCRRYSFDGTNNVGKMVTVTVTTTNFYSLLILRDAESNILDWSCNYYDGAGPDDQVQFHVINAGTYFVEVTSWFAEQTGDYTLRVDCTNETIAILNVFTNAFPVFTANSDRLPIGGLIDFGTINTNTSATNWITLTNSGNGNLVISNITIAPAANAPTNNGNGFTIWPTNVITLPPGGITNLAVSLFATNWSEFGGYFIFDCNDRNMDYYYAYVSGQVSPPSVPWIQIDYPTNGMAIPVTNSVITNVVLEIDAEAIALTGIQKVEFYTNYPGTPFRTLPGSPYYTVYWTNPPAGQRTITAKAYDNSSPQKTALTNVIITVGYPTLTLSPTNACVGLSNTAFTVTATLYNATNGLVSGSNVTFTVTGAHNLTFTTITVNGQASFTYIGTNFGLDTITATATVVGIPAQAIPMLRNWARFISCGNTLPGVLTNTDGTSIACGCAYPSHYTDFYSFTTTVGATNTFKMASPDFSTFMFLMSTGCVPIAVTNEMLNTNDTQMRVILPAGTYIVEATSADIFKTGNYSLSLLCGPPTTPHITVSVNGTNFSNSSLLDLGTTTNGTAITRTIGVTNTGGATLYLTNYSWYYGPTNGYSITLTPGISLAPGTGTNFILQFLSTSSGQFQDRLILTNNDPDQNLFVIFPNAISNPDGSAPVVVLTAPTNNAWFYAPADIPVAATATPSGAGVTITNVEFGFRLQNGPDWFFIGRDTNGPLNYSTVWNAQTPGTYTLAAAAWDSLGRKAISLPVTNVQVRIPTNNPSPKANTDIVTVLANSRNNVLNLLTNDTDPNGYPLTIINYKLSTAPGPHGTMKIVDDGKHISYTPVYFIASSNNYPADGFSYEISNGKGGTNWGSVLVIVYGGPMPQIQITNPPDGSTLVAGTTSIVMWTNWPAEAVSNIVRVEFYDEDVKIGEVTNAPANGTWPWFVQYDYCQCGLKARVIDKFGQFSEWLVHYTVNPPTNSNLPMPFAQITSPALISNYPQVPSNPERNAEVTDGMLVVSGSVYQATNGGPHKPVQYKVLIKTPDGAILRDSGWQTEALIESGPIYTNDLTTLQNDSYVVELAAQNTNSITHDDVPFLLNSGLKLGVFTFSEQDLVIPAGGTPLSVIRTYNSINPLAGDFGYSWTYALQELNVAFHEDRGTVRSEDGIFSMRISGSRDVTLTLPNGQRTTFYYYEEPGYMSSTLIPRYYAPPEAHAQLRPVNSNGSDIAPASMIGGYDPFNPLWIWNDEYNNTMPYNNFDFPAYLLKLEDGTEYFIKRQAEGTYGIMQGDPGTESVDFNAWEDYTDTAYSDQTRVAWIKLPSNEKIVINDPTTGPTGGQFSVDYFVDTNKVRSVYFQRNGNGQISAIIDPISQLSTNNSQPPLPVVKYEYDGETNLVRVLKLQDRNAQTYATNTYLYENGYFPHYLTKILDPRGVPLARNIYDDNGKLKGVVDANGKTNLFVYDITGQTETVFDRMNNPTTYVYDSHGNVTTEIDALNHVTHNTYDDPNYPSAVTSTTIPLNDTTSYTTHYAYDSHGYRNQVVDPLNHTTLFTNDSSGNLLAQVDPVGNLTVNTYDDAGNLTNTVQKDAQGNMVGGSSSIYQDNRLVETRDVSNRVVATFAYDASGNLTNTTDASGSKRFFSYDSNGNQTGSSFIGTNTAGQAVPIATTNVYDAAGRVTMTIDALGNTNQTFYNAIGKADYTVDRLGNTNRYLYDARGNLIQTITPFGTTRTFYDDNARPALTTDANGISGTLTEYDPVGRVTCTIRATNVMIVLQADLNNPGQTNSVVGSYGVPYSTNSTEYYDNGWVKSRTGPNGQTTRYTYYADGQTAIVTDPLNYTTQYFYDDAGRQSQIWDALMHPTRFGYDALGRQVTTTFADGTSITNEYNLVGQRTATVDQAKLRTQFSYNISGSLTNVMKPQVPNPENNNYPATPQWNYQYDEQGRLLVMTDPKGRSTTNRFDEFGRQYSQRLPLTQTNWTEYYLSGQAKGQVWKQHDFKGQTLEYRYDQYGRVTNKYYFTVTDMTHPSNSVAYYYNTLGQLTNITELSGTQAGQGYAALVNPSDNLLAGRARHSVRAVLASLNNHPNTSGGFAALLLCAFALTLVPGEKRRQFALALMEEWGSARALACRYGERTRLACGVRRPRRTPRLRLPSLGWRLVTPVVMFALLASEPGFDQLWTAHASCDYPQNLSGDTARYTYFTYDFDGHLTQVNCPEGVINYGYDLATGRHLSTCTTNSYVEYGYDELGRLKTVHALKRNGQAIDETTTYHYDWVGNRSEVDLPNGIVTTYLYDSLNRLTNLTQVVGTTNLASYSYTLHATGRRTGATEILRQEDNTYLTNTITWQYDGMYRLTNEVSLCSSTTYSYTNAFQYDLVGNRYKQVKTAGSGITTTTNLYNDNDHLLSEVTLTGSSPNSTNNYTYDLNGSVVGKTNISSSGTATALYTYNLANKMCGVTANGSTTYYQYNDSGIRVRSVMGTSTNLYLVDANNHTGYAQVLEELTAPNTPATTSYVISDDVLAQATGSAVSYLLYDGHGSTRQVIDNTLKVASKYNYEAYGITQGNSYNISGTSLRYCGEQYDSTLGMYSLRARYYDPANGRFNQRDTFEGTNFDPQTLHKYTYAGCDPVNNLDPSGLQFSMVEILVVSGVIGILSADVALACGASYKTAIYVGLLAAFITAAVMLTITFWPEIVQAFRAWLQIQKADITVTNGLYRKLLEKFGENATRAQKIDFFSDFGPVRLFLEKIGGYLQKFLWDIVVNPRMFWKWFQPTLFDGLSAAGIVTLIWVYRKDIKELYEDLSKP